MMATQLRRYTDLNVSYHCLSAAVQKRQVPAYIPDFASISAKNSVHNRSDPTGILRESSRITQRNCHSLTCLLPLTYVVCVCVCVCVCVWYPVMVRSLASTWHDQKQNLLRCLESAGLRMHQSHQGWIHKPESCSVTPWERRAEPLMWEHAWQSSEHNWGRAGPGNGCTSGQSKGGGGWTRKMVIIYWSLLGVGSTHTDFLIWSSLQLCRFYEPLL